MGFQPVEVSWQSRLLYPGEAEGEVLRFDAPISFWGGVDPESARITLSGHPQIGCSVSAKILVIPFLIGSSSSSAIVLELLYRNLAPGAVVLGDQDAILPIGVLVAKQMGWPTIPVALIKNLPFATGDQIRINTDGRIDRLPH